MPSGWARIKDAVLPFCNDLFKRNRLFFVLLCSCILAPPWAPLSEKVNTERLQRNNGLRSF